nr:sialoadhesin-like isoform X2 [Caretta caretta]
MTGTRLVSTRTSRGAPAIWGTCSATAPCGCRGCAAAIRAPTASASMQRAVAGRTRGGVSQDSGSVSPTICASPPWGAEHNRDPPSPAPWGQPAPIPRRGTTEMACSGAQRQTPGGAGASELRISPSQLDPGAALRCQVDGYWDECDSDQSQPLGTVTPNVPRVAILWPARKAALREGDGFTLRCQAAALWPVTRYVWSRGDVWLPETRRDLRVEKAAVSDGGNYVCGVWVSGPGWGYLSLSARESVEVQRVHVTAAPDTSPQAGASVTLTCSYTSSLPTPNSYTWYRGDRQLGGSQQEMVLKSITAEQAGEYRCQADNGIGQSPSPPINITVLSTPRVWAPTYILGPAVALVLLLLVGLVGVIAWRKRRSKRQGLSSDPDQPGPGETPMSERIYENTQHYGMGKPARLAPPRAPSVPTEVCPGSPDGTRESHIYSQPMNTGKVPQSDPDEVHYAAVQLQPPTRRAEPTCEYAVIKR